jgi:hypothetical protein
MQGPDRLRPRKLVISARPRVVQKNLDFDHHGEKILQRVSLSRVTSRQVANWTLHTRIPCTRCSKCENTCWARQDGERGCVRCLERNHNCVFPAELEATEDTGATAAAKTLDARNVEDEANRALDKLINLRMNDNQRVHRYTVSFWEYADELNWPDGVLRTLYYRGLPDRIKDLWTTSYPPANLNDLIAEAQRADLRYWCRVEEKKEQKNRSSHTDRSSHTQKSKSSHHASSSSSSSNNKHSLSLSSTQPAKPKSKDFSNILGPDGKLLPEEKARRKKLGSCVYCAQKHSTDQCPIKPASRPPPKTPGHTTNTPKSKGRVARVYSTLADGDSGSESSEATSDF